MNSRPQRLPPRVKQGSEWLRRLPIHRRGLTWPALPDCLAKDYACRRGTALDQPFAVPSAYARVRFVRQVNRPREDVNASRDLFGEIESALRDDRLADSDPERDPVGVSVEEREGVR